MKRDYLREETFGNTFPYKAHYQEINGFQMHYVDEGKGEPIVMFHGMPTWGYLYRKFIKILSKSNRVIVPDQMGFGKSDVPQDKPYLLKQHLDNTSKLLLGLDLREMTIVVQDWGGPIGIGFGVHNADRIKQLVIMNTSIGIMKEGAKPWYQPLVEKGIYESTISNIEGLITSGIYNKSNINKNMLKAYSAPFPDKKSLIGAFAWPKDIPVGDSHPSANTMRYVRQNLDVLKDKKKILIWGMKDPIFSKKMISWWEKIYPGIEIFKIENASHFLQEDAPEEIISIIQDFIKNN
jgi:haloalkane dehalogenase